jgi:hypothetical protein
VRLLLVVLAGCATAPAHPIPIAVLVDGDRAGIGDVSPHAVAGLELHDVALPAPSPPAPDDAAAVIARARSGFAGGDFDACRGELGNVEVGMLLARNERGLAARALVLGAACAWPDRAGAEMQAGKLASFGLELPDMTVPAELERLLGAAITAAGKAPRAPLAVTGVVGARLAIDGRPGGCALPCTVDVAPGDHVVAVEADGYMPAWRLVRSPDVATVALAQDAASPQLAALQWRARIGRGLPATDATGAALVARLAGDRRVAVLHGDTSLTAAMVVDGALAASVTRPRGDAPTALRELAYDSGVLHRPSIYQRPWFWIAVSGAVVAIAGAIVIVEYQPEIRTKAVF